VKNVQITIDERTLAGIDRAGKRRGLKRSQIVREALRDWLRRQAVERFEQDWIAALRSSPDEATRAEVWLDAQAWSEE
jgi:metal-responsive CopG/Arc/MetJ family transcriptional regulator